MSINLDVIVGTEEHSVDMKSGLDTLQGASEATRYIAETILTGKVVQRQTPKSKVRTTLKQSFRGSYGHVYSLDIYDNTLERKFKSIGRETFAELMTYFINESALLCCSLAYYANQRLHPSKGSSASLYYTSLRTSTK